MGGALVPWLVAILTSKLAQRIVALVLAELADALAEKPKRRG